MARHQSFIGAGRMWGKFPAASGQPENPYLDLGHIVSLDLDPEFDEIPVPDRQTGVGNVDEVQRLNTLNGTLVVQDRTALNWRMGIAGSVSSSQSGNTTITDEAIGQLPPGKVGFLPTEYMPDVNQAWTLTDDTPTTIDPAQYVQTEGGIYFPAGNTIADSTNLLLTYPTIPDDQDVIEAHMDSDIVFAAELPLINTMNQSKPSVHMSIYKLKVSAGAVPILSDDQNSIQPLELAIELLSEAMPTGKSPFYKLRVADRPVDGLVSVS